MSVRTIKKIVAGKTKSDGAGVKLTRVFSYGDVKDFDPFLMLDAFDSTDPSDYINGFPWHPHRGIETVTYLLEGNIEHGDSLGNKGTISNGDCQWMTAGSGIIHQEMPKPSHRLQGLQFWVNLPEKNKMTTPTYRDIVKDSVPLVKELDATIRIISGEYRGTQGAIEGNYVKPVFMDVEVKGGCQWSFVTEKDSTVFVYIFNGKGAFDPNSLEYIPEKNAVLFNEGKKFWVKASEEGIRFILVSGVPLKEPIAWGGPIVMNTKEELDLAFKEIDEGTFIKGETNFQK